MNLDKVKEEGERIVEGIGNIIVGDKLLFTKMLCASLTNGHVLFEDYPGLGKTLLVKTFAMTVNCDWKRIQFTPDLMPADILGTRVWKSSTSDFIFERGPIFTNFLLADEINRSPPKTQSALLEAMEERQVTIEGTTSSLRKPFFVMATQNPIELEGTYPLPEAQVDRFCLKLSAGYVDSIPKEVQILKRRIDWKNDDPTSTILPVVDVGTFIGMQEFVENSVFVDEQILDYIAKIVRLTREHRMVQVGCSPRGGLALLKLSRAIAALQGRDYVIPDDVKLFAREALAHRIILNVENLLEGVSPTSIVDDVVPKVEAPKEVARR